MSGSVTLGSCLIVGLAMLSPLAAQVPEFPPAAWTYQSNQASSALGTWVSGAGDVNGDGFDDVIVSATGYDGANEDEGQVLLFLGSAAGLSSSPDWSVSGLAAGAELSAREKAGDINGDGFDDVLLSDGRLFFGSFSGLSPDFQTTTVTNYFGRFQSIDIDSDGYGDIALTWDLWHGSPSGLSKSGAAFRKNLKGSGRFMLSDLTADGYVDLVVATVLDPEDLRPDDLDQGTLHLFLGGPNGQSRRESVVPYFAWAFAGADLRAVGDVDADGYNDFVVALFGDASVTPVPGWFSNLYYFRGSSSGYVAPRYFASSGDASLSHYDGAGDVNGDGYGDLLIVAGGNLGQRVHFFAGGPGGPAFPPTAALLVPDIEQFRVFSRLASGAGDVNGDGYDDLIVASPGFSDGEAGEGRVSLYLGSASFPVPVAP